VTSEPVAPAGDRIGQPRRHDVVVAGAGPVGATRALALADSGLDVVALDARAAGEIARGDRSLALSHGSRLILECLGVWAPLAALADAVTPITAIDISQAGGFGTMRIDAQEQAVPALGYVVSYRALQAALDEALAARGAAVRHGARVARVLGDPAHATVTLADGEMLHARLAVAADGAGDIVAGMARKRRDYGQVALVAKVWLERPHGGLAYERFTAQGPVALLPEADHYGLVWTHTPQSAAAALDLDDSAFLAALGAHFGPRVRGFVRVAQRRTFPLALEYAEPLTQSRVAAIGNAAQALHPIAGQGFNLGLRDAHVLAEAIAAATPATLGTPAMLARYAAARALDRRAGIAFTDGLVHLFGGSALRWPRGLGVALLDAVPPVKRAFTRRMLYGWR
jgi:2-octaprenyl-6-methoxyphenol hydroxylase